MSDLIERALMTNDDLYRAWATSQDGTTNAWVSARSCAAAATAKALWAVVEWLEEEAALDMQSLRASLRGALVTAGLDSPPSLLKVNE